MPSITRRTDKGLPQYRDSFESDIFVLSGAEDLVPVLICDDDGQPRHDEFECHGYRVKRYRPRIEGLFARIERWAFIATGEAHWRSLSKNNVLTVLRSRCGVADCRPRKPRPRLQLADLPQLRRSPAKSRRSAASLRRPSSPSKTAPNLPEAKAKVLYAVQEPFQKALLTGKTTQAARRSKPNFFAVSTEDRTINPDLERFMVKRMDAKTIEVKASHLSLISHPDEITGLILEAGGQPA